MAYSNKFNSLLLTTGNKSELATGYCTLYGDMSGGLAVIGDLLKVQVYAMARAIKARAALIPAAIIEKPPSAELRPGSEGPGFPCLRMRYWTRFSKGTSFATRQRPRSARRVSTRIS